MHTVVVASGELPAGFEQEVGATLRDADLVVAADGGLLHCRVCEVWPDVLVGDLDSVHGDDVSRARANGVQVSVHPTDKNATDLELALDLAVERGASSISVVCAFGGRLDHELATIGLLAADQWAQIDLKATDGRRQLWVVRNAVSPQLAIGRTVSLVPWSNEVTGVTTTGLQWPLRGETLPRGSTRGVSNIVIDDSASISIETGVLLIVSDQTETLGRAIFGAGEA